MQIKIIRKWFTEKSTTGVLSINGIKCGFTLEDVARAEGVKIPGVTAAPAGTYKVVNDYSEHFKKIMPHILNVPRFEGVRFHGGNKPEDTEGCILVGLKKGEDSISMCQAVFDYLKGSIDEAMKNKEVVELTIINEKVL